MQFVPPPFPAGGCDDTGDGDGDGEGDGDGDGEDEGDGEGEGDGDGDDDGDGDGEGDGKGDGTDDGLRPNASKHTCPSSWQGVKVRSNRAQGSGLKARHSDW